MHFPPPSDKQARLIWFSLSAVCVTVVVVLLVGMLWGLGQLLHLLAPVLWPLAFAAALAYLMDPVVDWFVRRRVPRARAIVLVFVFALVLLAGVVAGIIPQAFREGREFVQRVPVYAVKIENRVAAWMTNPPVFVIKFLPEKLFRRDTEETNVAPLVEIPEAGLLSGGEGTNGVPGEAVTDPEPAGAVSGAGGGRTGVGRGAPDWGQALDADTLRSATQWLSRVLPQAGSWLFGQVSRVGAWFGFIAGAFLVPVYVFYFLLEKQGIEKQWTDYLPVRDSRFKEEMVFCLRAINDYLIVFFRSQVLVAICDGILYTTGFLVIGLPYAFLIGLMATVLTMIPFLGAITTCVAAVVIGFASTGSWHLPALVLVVFAVVQTLEGLVISPKIMGDRVGLHPLTIIVAVMVGTTLFGGLLGGILAIPVTAALRVIMFRYIWVRRTAGASGPATG